MKKIIFVAMLALIPACAMASEIHFSVSAQETVANTQMRLVFRTMAETNAGANSLPALSVKVNRVMSRALKMIARQPALTAQTLGMSTRRLYSKSRPAGWQVSGEIAVSGPAGDLPALAGQLQAMGLSIESVSSMPSEKAQQAAQTRLTRTVLRRLRSRADLIANTLDCSHWSFTRIDLGKTSPIPPRPVMFTRAAATPAPLAGGREKLSLKAFAAMRCKQN